MKLTDFYPTEADLNSECMNLVIDTEPENYDEVTHAKSILKFIDSKGFDEQTKKDFIYEFCIRCEDFALPPELYVLCGYASEDQKEYIHDFFSNLQLEHAMAYCEEHRDTSTPPWDFGRRI